MGPKMKNPLFVALDVDSADQALALAKELKDVVGGFKIGPRLVVPHGAELIGRLAQWAPVFIDLKYLDIPSTMEAAIRASFAAGASWATVHAWAGPQALQRMAECEAELNKQRPFQILAVTILTSFSPTTLPIHLQSIPIEKQVSDLAQSVAHAGLSGLVSSAWELPSLPKNLFKVVPGVRSSPAVGDDQARTLTAREALDRGASALVIGRPIVQAPQPRQATESILATLGDL